MAEVNNNDQADSVMFDSDQKCLKVRVSARHANSDIHGLVGRDIDGIVYHRLYRFFLSQFPYSLLI
jgi:hypothetical protein